MFSKDQIAKARTAKSAEELLTLAEEENLPMTFEEAQGYFNKLHGSYELDDAELEAVSGGKDDDESPKPKYQYGDHFKLNNGTVLTIDEYNPSWSNNQFLYHCRYDKGYVSETESYLSQLQRVYY